MFLNSLNLRKISSAVSSRILDGIFIGNYIPLQEEQYLNMNQITHVINCSGLEIQAPSNLNVLIYNWKEEDNQIIVTIQNVIQITIFVESAIKKGESVLFCCLNGQSRSLSALIGYLMYRYKWSLIKVLQFINIQKKDFEIRKNFYDQLTNFEKQELNQFVLSQNWNQISGNLEQTLLQNTYLNSVQKKNDEFLLRIKPKTINQTKKNVSWAKSLIYYGPKLCGPNFTQFLKQGKSILKTNNINVFGGNNSFSKECSRNSTQITPIVDEDKFIRKNNYRQSDKKQRNLTPYNIKRNNNQNLITPNQKFNAFLDIEIYSQQIQRNFRSQTQTPRRSSRFSSLDNQNNSSILSCINQETRRKSPQSYRKAQFKLVNLI